MLIDSAVAHLSGAELRIGGAGKQLLSVCPPSVGADRRCRRWNGVWEVAPLPSGHAGSVDAVAVSPDGKLIASGATDRLIKLWDRATGLEVQTLAGHTLGVASLAWAPDGKTLVSSGLDRTIRVWDVKGGKEIPWRDSQPLNFKDLLNPAPRLQVDHVARHRAEAELGARDVLEDGHLPTHPLGRGADPLDRLGVLLRVAVREVQPRHVHADRDHLLEDRGLPRGRSDRRDDLGRPHRGRYTPVRGLSRVPFRTIRCPGRVPRRSRPRHASADPKRKGRS